jgi:hypothetical protein
MMTKNCEKMTLSSEGRIRRRRLWLDNVIGSQPELGPAPPDGGYGWVILFGAMVIQVGNIFFLRIKVL